MSKEETLSEEFSKRGNLSLGFNSSAEDSCSQLHESLEADLLENNIATSLVMGSDAFIGRKDQYHYHENEKREKAKLDLKRNRDVQFYRIFINSYLKSLREMIKDVQERIDVLIYDITETETQLNLNLDKLSENEVVLDELSMYMQTDHFARRNDMSLQDDDLHCLIVFLGYHPNTLSDSDMRKIIDTHASNLQEQNEILKEMIYSDTKSLSGKTDELNSRYAELTQLKELENKVVAVCQSKALSEEEKYEAIKTMGIHSGITIDGLDELRNRALDQDKHSQALDVISNAFQSEDKKLSVDLDSNSLSAFLPKP